MDDSRDDAAPQDLAALIARTLAPVLVPAGFAPAQVGEGPSEVGAVFCASYVELRDRYGDLDGGDDDDPPDQHRCSDVNVYLRWGADARPYLDEVHLDGLGLAGLLRRVGLGDLAAEAEGLDRPADPATAAGYAVLGWDGTGPVTYTRADLARFGASGPLAELPVIDALTRAGELLAAAFAAAAAGPGGGPARTVPA